MSRGIIHLKRAERAANHAQMNESAPLSSSKGREVSKKKSPRINTVNYYILKSIKKII